MSTKISQLPSASALSGSEVTVLVQDGQDVKCPVSAFGGGGINITGVDVAIQAGSSDGRVMIVGGNSSTDSTAMIGNPDGGITNCPLPVVGIGIYGGFNGSGSGGDVLITAGSPISGSGSGGDVLITGGVNSGDYIGGNIEILAGGGLSSSGGNVTLAGGTGDSGGGSINLSGGTGGFGISGSGASGMSYEANGGNINIIGGDGTAGGAVNISGGNAGSGGWGVAAGFVWLTGGQANSGAQGADVVLQGGAGNYNGRVAIVGGNTGSSNSSMPNCGIEKAPLPLGSGVAIYGGAWEFGGGDLMLTAGSPNDYSDSASAQGGDVLITGGVNANVSGGGNVEILAGGGMSSLGGGVTLAGGTGDSGGGTINILGGVGGFGLSNSGSAGSYFANGGNINIIGGDGNWGGSIGIQAGFGTSQGGDVTINAGNSGTLQLFGGNSAIYASSGGLSIYDGSSDGDSGQVLTSNGGQCSWQDAPTTGDFYKNFWNLVGTDTTYTLPWVSSSGFVYKQISMLIECGAPGDSTYTLNYEWHDTADNVQSNVLTCSTSSTIYNAQAVFAIHTQASMGASLIVTKTGSTGYVNVMVDEKILLMG